MFFHASLLVNDFPLCIGVWSTLKRCVSLKHPYFVSWLSDLPFARIKRFCVILFHLMRSSQKSSFGLLQFFWRDLFRTFYHQFYILSDQVWWCNTKQLSSYFKNYICKFMQAYSWHHKLFHLHLSFCIWKVWKGREKIQKFEYLENEKSFLDEIKNTFLSFWRAIIWSKNKNLIKK